MGIMASNYEEYLATLIILRAYKRMKKEHFHDRNAAIHSVLLEVKQYLMEAMAINREEKKE